MTMEAIAPSEPKALRLARYLKEFVGLRTTTVYDVNKYESVLWFADMPQEPECQSPAWNDEFRPVILGWLCISSNSRNPLPLRKLFFPGLIRRR